MSIFDNNSGGGTFNITVVVERDQGVFLGLNVQDEDFDDVIDAVTTDPGEISQFFTEVARAKADWDRMRNGEEQS